MKPRPRLSAPPRIYPTAIVDAEARMGTDVVIGAFCYIAAGARIGAGTRLQSHISVWHGVDLGEDVFIGPSAVFTNVRRPRAAYPRAPNWQPTVVEDGATVGAAAVLIAPVRIGRAAMVGAAAVVTRDVPAHALVGGNPAKVLGWVCVCGESIALGARRPKEASCGDCRLTYEPDDAGGLRRSE